MGAAGFEMVNGSMPPQNALLFLGLAFALCAVYLLVLGMDRALEAVARGARALRFRRRVWAWRLALAVAIPTVGPLALATVTLLTTYAAARQQARLVARWAAVRRRALRPLAGRAT